MPLRCCQLRGLGRPGPPTRSLSLLAMQKADESCLRRCQCSAQGSEGSWRRKGHLVPFVGEGPARFLLGVRVGAVLESEYRGVRIHWNWDGRLRGADWCPTG